MLPVPWPGQDFPALPGGRRVYCSAHQLSVRNSRKTLLKVDENGLSGDAKRGLKTKNTHLNNIDAFGRNGYSQLASKAIIKGNNTKIKKGLILPPECRNEFYRYKSVVSYLTGRYSKEISKGYKTGVCGVKSAYQLDHMYSIFTGFKNKISPFIIGCQYNLKMIPWEENILKHVNCSIKIENLFEMMNYNHEKSHNEFNIIMELIHYDIENKTTSSGANILDRFYDTNL